MARKITKKIARRRQVRKRTSRVPKSIKSYVSRVIHSNIENKRLTTEFTKNLYNSSGGVANFQPNNIIPLSPNAATGGIYTITQGLGQQQRVGNQVSVRKVYFRGLLVPNGYNAVSNPTPTPLNVKLWIISFKRNVLQASNADVYNCLSTTFFANGNSSLGMLGNIYDIITPANKDVVRVHYQRTIKLGFDSYSGMTGGADATSTKAGNDYKLNYKMVIDCTKWMPKKLLFNDTDGGTTSRQMYAVFMPVNFNGASITAATTPCAFFGGLDIHYEDA